MKALISVLAGTVMLAAVTVADGQTPAPGQAVGSAPVTGPATPAPRPTPGALAAVAVLNGVCLPLLNGGKLQTLAPGVGLRMRNGRWRMPVGGKREVILSPPDTANPHLCSETIVHRAGSESAIFGAVDAWAKTQAPPLQPDKVQDQSQGTSYLRLTSTWTGQTPNGALGLVLTQKAAVAGSASGDAMAQSRLIVTLTKS